MLLQELSHDKAAKAAKQQIPDWLEKFGLRQYAQRFAENDIDFTILPELTDQDLEKIGVASLGHRRKILRAIAEQGRASAAAPATPAPSKPAAAAMPTPTAAAPPPPPAEAAGERRYLTVMFCDLSARPGSPRSSTPRSGAILSAPISMPPRRP